MAAIQLALSILKTGDQLISLDDLYGGDFRYFRYLATHAGINFAQWNGERIDDLLAMIEPNTRLIWLETPSNPTMKGSTSRRLPAGFTPPAPIFWSPWITPF